MISFLWLGFRNIEHLGLQEILLNDGLHIVLLKTQVFMLLDLLTQNPKIIVSHLMYSRIEFNSVDI